MLKLPLSDAKPVSSSLPFTSQAARIKYGAPAGKTADAAFLWSTLNPSLPSFLACFFLFAFLFCLFQTCHLPLPSNSSDLFPSLFFFFFFFLHEQEPQLFVFFFFFFYGDYFYQENKYIQTRNKKKFTQANMTTRTAQPKERRNILKKERPTPSDCSFQDARCVKFSLRRRMLLDPRKHIRDERSC